jgi:hypothetical protein
MTRLGTTLIVLFLGISAMCDGERSRVAAGGPNSKHQEPLAPPGPWRNPPKLGQLTSHFVRVRTEPELQQALSRLRSDTTIVIAPGTYHLSRSLQIGGGVKHVVLRGGTDDRNGVILKGRGMRQKDYGNVPHGIMVNDATDVVIANLAVGDVWFHPITLQGPAGCQRVRIFNVRLFDAGEQFIKGNPDGRGGGVDGGIVEYCVFEFTDTSRSYYTQGIDILRGADWIVRNNLFRNIRGPARDPTVGGCADFWQGCRNILVEGNVIVNCRMGIRFGIHNKSEKEHIYDQEGGIIRNNIVWRQPGAVNAPDGGIMVWDSPNTKVLNNTVILNGTYPNGCIEYRWGMGDVLVNNLTDGPIWQRDGARARVANNVINADPSIFVNEAAGDLHLAPKSQTVLHKVPVLRDCPTDLDGRPRGDKTDVGAAAFSPQ